MNHWNSWDTNKIDNVLSLYKSGKSINKIAKEIGAAPDTVSKYIKLSGETISHRRKKYKSKLSDLQKEEIEANFHNVLVLKDMAADYGVSYSTLRRFLDTKNLHVEFAEACRRRALPSEQRCLNDVFSVYRRTAEKRGLTFNLTKEQVNKLIFSKCFYCGRTGVNNGSRAWRGIRCNGIDRKDNSLGYSIENVVSCCKECNMLKSNKTIEQFYFWIKIIYENLNIDDSEINYEDIPEYKWGSRSKKL